MVETFQLSLFGLYSAP